MFVFLAHLGGLGVTSSSVVWVGPELPSGVSLGSVTRSGAVESTGSEVCVCSSSSGSLGRVTLGVVPLVNVIAVGISR